MKDAASQIPDVSLVSPVQSMKTRKVLNYESKLITFDWSPDQRHVIGGGEVSQALCSHMNGFFVFRMVVL